MENHDPKKKIQYSLTESTRGRIEHLARKFAIPKSAVISIAIQKFYEEEAKRSAK
jgi:predicted transcriptional regulator